MEIIALGEIAISGTAKLIDRYGDKLKRRFRPDLLLTVKSKSDSIYKFSEEDFSNCEGFIAVSSGGIFASLWDLSENLNCGLRINLKDIPVSQEIIEICNFLDVNPYELESQGMYLLAVNSGYSFCEELNAKGISATIIGYTTDDNDRIIRNGSMIRYIDKNRGKEELERVL